jgi:hypothetical protein
MDYSPSIISPAIDGYVYRVENALDELEMIKWEFPITI